MDHLVVKDTLEEKEYMGKEETLGFQDNVVVSRYLNTEQLTLTKNIMNAETSNRTYMYLNIHKSCLDKHV